MQSALRRIKSRKNPENTWRAPLQIVGLLLGAGILGACTQLPTEVPCDELNYQVNDPGASVNRKVFAFNKGVDTYALKPVAHGYKRLPELVQHGVHNFTSNFGEPKVFINDVLQGNIRRSANTLQRFVVNSTVGVLGLMDVATGWDRPYHEADFGQTFGVWGLRSGPTVELPLFGSSNVRDSVGKVANFVLDPFGNVNSSTYSTLSTVNTVGDIVDGRARALPLTDKLELSPDYYSALRDKKGEHRSALVLEGKQGAVTHSTLAQRCLISPEDADAAKGAL
ncbi:MULTISPECIES: VacJ family lipoprotein [unclassified Pseudomonas]|uniref:MlaA family lipoprotein n=1 Tax=unclassified Pseudomonas TaxID=196821 RepID=UPI002B236B71|nr:MULTISPECIES: VacJ family lipoprotein [unclassified Pseudomonas]MEA9978836.1 VacJ family lipoprotein [Pseudomonas sp. RTS4]MEB0196153.1 VacJ family lipoprotein [Pseudomonas sp. 5S4]MEB0245443.1 VacJ family lipoprotein [Pseudomonas sp. 10S5]